VVDMENCTIKEKSLASMGSSETVPVLSFHYENKPPIIVVQHSPLPKAARSSLLKGMHVPKQKKSKKDDVVDENQNAEARIRRSHYFVESK
jgi:hypothetical protein